MQTPEQNKWEGEHQAGNPTALASSPGRSYLLTIKNLSKTLPLESSPGSYQVPTASPSSTAFLRRQAGSPTAKQLGRSYLHHHQESFWGPTPWPSDSLGKYSYLHTHHE